jgi:hypothetical protein
MWITVYSNSNHADLRSSADSIMRPYTVPGLHIHFDTCSVVGRNAILAETWDGYYGEIRTDLLETYVFQHRDVVISLTFPLYNYVSGRGDTLWLAEDREYVLRSISLF